MEDLISLNCPSCGAILEVNPATATLKCHHCGGEHMVRRVGDVVSLESFARCPKCGRNDRVEKVTAILRSHKLQINATEQRTETYLDQAGKEHKRVIDVPVSHIQVSGLAKILVPPQKPDPIPQPVPIPAPTPEPRTKVPKPKSIRTFIKIALCVVGPLLMIPGCLLSIVSVIMITENPDIGNIIMGILFLLLLGAGTVLLAVGIIIKPASKEKTLSWKQAEEESIQRWKSDNESRRKDWAEANQKRISDWKALNSDRKKSWQLAMENWNNLYFCHRDDCVFVPGDNNAAPIEELERYLFKDFQKPY